MRPFAFGEIGIVISLACRTACRVKTESDYCILEPKRQSGRGRDRGCPRPPAQIRAGGTTALGSYLEFWRRNAPKAKDDRFSLGAAID